MENKRKNAIYELGLVLCGIIWGSTYPLTKFMVDGYDPIVMIAIRFTLSAIALFLFYRRRFSSLNKETVRAGLILGFVLFMGYIIQTTGTKYTDSSKQAFLTGAYVVMVPFLAAFIRKKMFLSKEVYSAILCFAGILVLSNAGVGGGFNKGDAMSLGSGFFYALYVALASEYNTKHDPIQLTVLQMGTVGLLGAVGSLFFGSVPTADPVKLAVLLYLTFVATLLTFPIQNVCQGKVSASVASVIMSLETPFGGIFGILFLSEPFSVRFLFGGALCLVAILISNLPDRRKLTDGRNRES